MAQIFKNSSNVGSTEEPIDIVVSTVQHSCKKKKNDKTDIIQWTLVITNITN